MSKFFDVNDIILVSLLLRYSRDSNPQLFSS